MWAALDATWHGSVVALTIVDRPDQVRQQLDKQAGRDGTTVREIPAPDAARRLEAGIDAFLLHGRPPGVDRKDDTYGELFASLGIARHRAAALAGPAGQPPGRGLPQDRFAWYTAVTEQIWTNDPPQVWATAQRMQAAGSPRDAILDRLAQIWHTTGTQNADGYAAALSRLAPPRSR